MADGPTSVIDALIRRHGPPPDWMLVRIIPTGPVDRALVLIPFYGLQAGPQDPASNDP